MQLFDFEGKALEHGEFYKKFHSNQCQIVILTRIFIILDKTFYLSIFGLRFSSVKYYAFVSFRFEVPNESHFKCLNFSEWKSLYHLRKTQIILNIKAALNLKCCDFKKIQTRGIFNEGSGTIQEVIEILNKTKKSCIHFV